MRVLRALTEEPVPFALVDVSEDLSQDDAEQSLGGWFQLPENATTRRFRADAAGRAFLPRAPGGAYATCAAEDAWGFVELDPSTENDLRLFPDPPLRVRVLDAEGGPVAGAGVALHVFDGYEAGKLLGAATDAAGLAELRCLRWPLLWYEEGYLTQVRLEGVFDPPVLSAFDPAALPLELVLVQPPLTRLEVQVVTEEGEGVDGPAVVTVAPAVEESDEEEEPFADGRRIVAAPVQGGRAVFERVGVDLPLVIVASAPERGEGEQIRVRSAPRAGETIAARAPLGIQRLVLLAELVSPSGEPLAPRAVEVRATAKGRVLSPDARTDPGGKVRVEFDGSWFHQQTIDLEFLLPGATPLFAQTLVHGPFEVGERFIGRLQLEPAPRIVAGRVIDEAGGPVAGARIALYWEYDLAGRATSAADGSFAVYGSDLAEEKLRLVARCPQHASLRVDVARGEEGLLLTLARRGSIAGSLLVPLEWWCSELAVDALREDTGELFYADVDRPGVFHIEELEPATYTVRFRLKDETEVALASHGVVVRAGEPTRDPRLQRIDLATLRSFELAVTDPAGAPVSPGWIYVRESGGPGWSEPVLLLGGRGACRTLAPVLEAFVVAEGFRAGVFEGLRGGERLTLEPRELQVRLRSRQALPEGLSLESFAPYLESEEPDWPPCRLILRSEEEGMVAHLSFPGRYALVLQWPSVARTAEDPLRSFRIPVEVPDREGTHEIAVDVPGELLSLVEEFDKQ